MRKIMGMLLFLFMLQGLSYGADVPRISVDELKARLGSAEVIVLDVRQMASYNDSKMKIKGSIRENPAMIGTWLSKYPKDKEIVLYCT